MSMRCAVGSENGASRGNGLACAWFLMLAVVSAWNAGCGGDAGERPSTLGRRVLRVVDGAWFRGETEHLVVYAQSSNRLDQIMRKAEYTYRETGRTLDLPPARDRSFIYVLTNRVGWKTLKTRSRWRYDGIGLQSGRDFVLFEQGSNVVFRDDVPHEVVHMRLRDAYGYALPLALEEGLAVYLGWEINLGYHLLHGEVLTHSEPTMAEHDLMEIEALVAAERYPAASEKAQAFYRQAGSWVRAIVGLIGKENLGTFVRQMAEDSRSWDALLADEYGLDARDFATVQRAVELSLYDGVSFR